MAGHLLGLKVALLRNRARALARHPERLVIGGFVLAVVAASWSASGMDAIDRLSSVHEEVDSGRVQVQAMACLLVLFWLVAPLATTSRRDLTVRKFVLLPMGATALTAGLYLAGLLSIGPLLTVAFVGVTAAGYLDSAVNSALVVLGASSLVVLAVTAGRLIGLTLDLLALLPRARLYLGLTTLPVVLVVLGAFELARTAFEDADKATSTSAPAWLSWLPPAWAGTAIVDGSRGEVGSALPALAGVVALTAVLAVLLRLTVARTLVTDDRSGASVVTRSGDPFGSFAHRLPASRVGAIAARGVRLFVRTPGRLTGYAFFVGVFGLLLSLVIAVVVPHRFAPLAPLIITFALTVRRANEIGADSNGYWMDVVSNGPRRDDGLGRDLAAVLVDGPLLVVVVVAYSVVWGAWAMIPAALGAVAAGWLVGAAVAHVIALRLASADASATDSRRSGSGSTSGGYVQALASELGFFVLIVPVAVAVIVPAATDAIWLAITVPGAMAYGAGLWLVSTRWSACWLDRHEADLLQTLTAT